MAEIARRDVSIIIPAYASGDPLVAVLGIPDCRGKVFAVRSGICPVACPRRLS